MFNADDVVYVAGPMTGLPMLNYLEFYGWAGLIKKEFGCRVLNPARHENGLEYEEYMRRAFFDLECATAVVFLHGWDCSGGATRELIKARELGIKIVNQYAVEDAIKAKIGNKNN